MNIERPRNESDIESPMIGLKRANGISKTGANLFVIKDSV